MVSNIFGKAFWTSGKWLVLRCLRTLENSGARKLADPALELRPKLRFPWRSEAPLSYPCSKAECTDLFIGCGMNLAWPTHAAWYVGFPGHHSLRGRKKNSPVSKWVNQKRHSAFEWLLEPKKGTTPTQQWQIDPKAAAVELLGSRSLYNVNT